MSIQIAYTQGAPREPERCQILINGSPLFKNRKIFMRGDLAVTAEGIRLGPVEAIRIFLGATQEICERGRAEVVLDAPAARLKLILFEDQRIQMKVEPETSARPLVSIKEEWTDAPGLTIDLFFQTDQALAAGWQGWKDSQEYLALKEARKGAETAYWNYLSKRRGEFDVQDDKRPTQGAAPPQSPAD